MPVECQRLPQRDRVQGNWTSCLEHLRSCSVSLFRLHSHSPHHPCLPLFAILSAAARSPEPCTLGSPRRLTNAPLLGGTRYLVWYARMALFRASAAPGNVMCDAIVCCLLCWQHCAVCRPLFGTSLQWRALQLVSCVLAWCYGVHEW